MLFNIVMDAVIHWWEQQMGPEPILIDCAFYVDDGKLGGHEATPSKPHWTL